MQKQDARILPDLGLDIYDDSWGQESLIEPRGTLHMRIRWNVFREADKVPHGARIHYHWQPTAREQIGKSLYFIRAKLPEAWAKHLPILYPHEQTSPLEFDEY